LFPSFRFFCGKLSSIRARLGKAQPIERMPFFLLEFAMQAIEPAYAICPNLSEASENRRMGRPKYRTGTAMDSKCTARSRKSACAPEARASAQRSIQSREGRWWENKESN
jgi:hypothetical protein